MNNPSEDQVVLEQEQTDEPDQTREPEGPHPDATFDEPPPQDRNINEQTEADTAIPDTERAAPIQASPVRFTSTPPSPTKLLEPQEMTLSLLAWATTLLAIL